jgi:hypothetical protein
MAKKLLRVLLDGYYLYDSDGILIWHLPDRNVVFAQFSSDDKFASAARCNTNELAPFSKNTLFLPLASTSGRGNSLRIDS